MIRYRCSPNRKLYRQEIGYETLSQISSESKGNRKFLGSGGSMVARLKLKRIDGRAPPGVELAAY